MEAQKKRQCLRLMKIDVWLPRFSFSNARPSISYPCTFDQQKKNLIHAQSKTPQQISPSNTIIESLSEDQSLKNHVKSDNTSNKNQEKKEFDSTTFFLREFHLIGIVPEKDTLIISDIPKSLGLQIPDKFIKLICSILFALNLKYDPTDRWNTNTFAWPLVGFPTATLPRNIGEAVQGFLFNHFSLEKKKKVLIFGPMSTSHLFLCYDQSPNNFFGTHLYNQNTHWGATYALDQLLKIPALKAEAWEHLKALMPASF